MKKPGRPRKQRRPKEQRAASVLGASAELVRAAAGILDEEMAIGVTAAKAVQTRLATEGRFEPADFKEALLRFQSDAHEVVNSLDAQLVAPRLTPNVDLAKRFIMRANDMVDLAVGIVTTSAELANELIQTQSTRPNDKPVRKRRR